MTYVPAISMAALRLEKAMVKNRRGVALTPAEIELIIFLIPILIQLVTTCVDRTPDEEKLEERAYQYLTRRNLWDRIFGNKTADIRYYSAKQWVKNKGNFETAQEFGNAVERETRSIGREYFHTLWTEARNEYKKRIVPPQGGSGTVKPDRRC